MSFKTDTIYKERVRKALEIVEAGVVDGDHHKMWIIDQMVQALTGEDYGRWVQKYCTGEDGPYTYEWDEGVAP